MSKTHGLVLKKSISDSMYTERSVNIELTSGGVKQKLEIYRTRKFKNKFFELKNSQKQKGLSKDSLSRRNQSSKSSLQSSDNVSIECFEYTAKEISISDPFSSVSSYVSREANEEESLMCHLKSSNSEKVPIFFIEDRPTNLVKSNTKGKKEHHDSTMNNTLEHVGLKFGNKPKTDDKDYLTFLK